MYIAIHHVTVDGKLYTRGQTIPDIPDEEQRERLLNAGAVHTMEAPAKKPSPTAAPAAEQKDDTADDEAEMKPGTAQAPLDAVDAPEDEEEEERLEIDPMDAVVDAPAPEEKPKRGRKKKEGGGDT